MSPIPRATSKPSSFRSSPVPSTNHPHRARLLAICLLSAWVTACGGGLSGAPINPVTPATTWKSVNFGGGGYVTGLIFHPTSQNVLYARTDVGGAYRWNEATMSWTPITDGFGPDESIYHSVESIALDPNNDQLVYMAAGAYATGTARLYISSDRGNDWTHVTLPFPTAAGSGRAIGERMMVDPNMSSTMFYATRTAGLWKSIDSGLTWAQVGSLSTAKMSSAQISANGDTIGVELVVYDTGTKGSGAATQTLYTAIAPDYVSLAGLSSNLYKSTNGGASWTPVSTPISGYYIPHIARAADGMFYVVFCAGPGPGCAGPAALYKFDGSTWTLLKDPNAGQTTAYGLGGVSVSGTGASTRIALGVTNSWGNYSDLPDVQLSDDDGKTWREIEAVMPHTPAGDPFWGWIDDVEIDPFNRDRVVHVHGGGVWETRNASSSTPSWTEGANIEETATLALATPPAGAPYSVIDSAGDIGTWLITDVTTRPTVTPGIHCRLPHGAMASAPTWTGPTRSTSPSSASSTFNNTPYGAWSGDGGKTWAAFATLAPGSATNTGNQASIAVTARNKAVWAPSNSVPSYTTDNGATWVLTNLPLVNTVDNRGYHLVADRKNPNKVYAYDSGGNWWGTPGKVYVSTDGGHTFTLSQSSVAAGLAPNYFLNTSLVVNPNVEGDLWLADGNAVYHSVNSGTTWTKLSQFASITTVNLWPDLQGATVVALGKAAPGAPYSAAVYVVGVVNGVWGVYRSDDAGVTWTRFNDGAHQFAGLGPMAADQNVYGRIYVGGGGRGVLYSN